MRNKITQQEAEASILKVKDFIKPNKSFKDLDDITLLVISELAIKELQERRSRVAPKGARPNRNIPDIE